MTGHRSDYDSPWKEAVARHFESFLAFFFPAVASQVDWSKGYELLESEFRQVVRDAAVGRRTVDVLVRVFLVGGKESWILVHVEVQNQMDLQFPERMFVYHYRVYDRYHRPVVSLAILGDSNPTWRPDRFETGECGCRLSFEFPVAKLLDYESRLPELEQSRNPFAVMVAAHLHAQRTSPSSKKRLQHKLALVRSLYERGFSREDVQELFRLVDWVLALSAENSRLFREELERYEQEKNMAYITSVERAGIKKGLQKGRRQGLQKGLQRGERLSLLTVLESRFASVPPVVRERIAVIEAPEVLTALLRQAATIGSMEEFLEALAATQQDELPS